MIQSLYKNNSEINNVLLEVEDRKKKNPNSRKKESELHKTYYHVLISSGITILIIALTVFKFVRNDVSIGNIGNLLLERSKALQGMTWYGGEVDALYEALTALTVPKSFILHSICYQVVFISVTLYLHIT